MVVFICNHCGDSCKKQQVDYHVSQVCRGTSISCVDCKKDFSATSYRDHIRCISEEEKYSGKNFQAKPNKGQQKQDLWTERLQGALANGGSTTPGGKDADLRSVIEKMLSYNNIPRKKAKFENFMMNSFRNMVTPAKIGRIWAIVEAEGAPPRTEDKKPQEEQTTIRTEVLLDLVEKVKKTKKKRNDSTGETSNGDSKKPKTESSNGHTVANGVAENGSTDSLKFELKACIMSLLKARSTDGLSLSKLSKRVLKASRSAVEDDDTDHAKFLKKFNSQLSKLAAKNILRLESDGDDDNTRIVLVDS